MIVASDHHHRIGTKARRVPQGGGLERPEDTARRQHGPNSVELPKVADTISSSQVRVSGFHAAVREASVSDMKSCPVHPHAR
jgi:hypothetical protein